MALHSCNNSIALDTARRYNANKMPSCVVVARGTLDPLALVRIQARQPPFSLIESFRYLCQNGLCAAA